MGIESSYFCEPDIRRFLPKALTANIQSILANETGGMGADTAMMNTLSAFASHIGALAPGGFRGATFSGLEMEPTSRVYAGAEKEERGGGEVGLKKTSYQERAPFP